MLLKKRSVAALVVQVLVTGTAMAQLSPSAVELQRSDGVTELAQGIIVAPERQQVFVMAPNDAVDALDLSDGSLLWSDSAGAKPLGLHGNLLAVQPLGSVDTLDIVFLDVLRPGSPAQVELPIALPTGVRASVDDQLGHSFRASVATRQGTPQIEWEHRQSPRGGARPEPQATAFTVTSERYVLDLAQARVTAAPSARPAPLPNESLAFSSGANVSTPPQRSGDLVVATALGDGRNELRLKRWQSQTGTELPDVVLTTPDFILDMPSADAQHLLVVERTGSGDREYTWRLISVATGNVVGSIESADSNAPFLVVGTTLLRTTSPYRARRGERLVTYPPTLSAYDLRSGTVLWRHEIRDTRFVGEVPP
ncbi:MAG: hypothetical protein AAGK22_06925 [Acidobacteriota bacterium]